MGLRYLVETEPSINHYPEPSVLEAGDNLLLESPADRYFLFQ